MPGGSGKEKLTVEYESVGAGQVVESEKRIADARRETTEAVEQAVPETEKAAATTEQLADANASAATSTGDLAMVLALLSPQLGTATTAGLAASNIAKSLASQNLLAAGAIGKATAAIAKFLPMAGGVGAAVGGGLTLYKVWSDIADEIERALKAAKDFAQLQTDEGAQREEARGKVAEAIIARGEATPEKLEAAAKREQGLRRRGYGDVSAEVAAATAGEGLDLEQAAQVAAGVKAGQIDLARGHAARQLEQAMASDRHRKIIEDTQATVRAEQARIMAGGVEQIEGFEVQQPWKVPWGKKHVIETGDRAKGERAITQITGRSAEDAARMYDLIQQLMAIERGEATPGQLGLDEGDLAADPFTTEARSVLQQMRGLVERGPWPVGGGRPLEVKQTVHIHRLYANRSGLRGGYPPRSWRDRSGRD